MAFASSWTKTTLNSYGDQLWSCANAALPDSATTVDTPEFILPLNPANNNRYVYVQVIASAVSGTNIDVALLGAAQTGGTFAAIISDTLVTDLATGTLSPAAVLDLNAYPAGAYKIRLTTDVNESANNATVYIFVPKI